MLLFLTDLLLKVCSQTDLKHLCIYFFSAELDIPITNLETSLQDYLRSPSTTPFDITTVPTEVPQAPTPVQTTKGGVAAGAKPGQAAASAVTPTAPTDTYSEQLAKV